MFEQYVEILWGFVKAFLVGGGICMIAQIVINFTDLTAGKILVIFMLSGVVLQGLGLYQYLVDFAGAGASMALLSLRERQRAAELAATVRHVELSANEAFQEFYISAMQFGE